MLGRVRGLIAVVVLLVAVCGLWWACTPESARDGAALDGARTAAPTDAIERVTTTARAASHPDRARPRASLPTDGSRCALSVRVETTAGVPMEGVVVSLLEAEHQTATDATGRAALGAVPRGATATVLVSRDERKPGSVRHEVEVPADAVEFETVVRLDPPLWPVLVVRLRADAPRERPVQVRCERASVADDAEVWPGRDVVRVPLPPPRPPSLRVTATCVGFLDSQADVTLPRAARDVVVELPLRAGGVPAWGRVLEADGTPAADAQVLACEGRRIETRVWVVNTNSEGRFALEDQMIGRSLVAVRQGVACSPWLDLTPAVRDVVLRLGPGAAAEGTVRDGDARAVAGALVEIHFLDKYPGTERWLVTTDDAGRYRAGGIPEGWWFQPCVEFGAGFGPLRGPLSEDTPEEFVARGEAHVAGGPGDAFRFDLGATRYTQAKYAFRLRFPRGEAIPETVTLADWTESGSAFGEVRIDPSDPVVSGDLDPERRVRVAVRAGRLQGETDWFTAEDGATRNDLVIEMRPTPRVIAQLVDAAGAPVRRREIEIRVGAWYAGGGLGMGSATTDDGGRADITEKVPMLASLERNARGVVFTMRGPGVLAREVLGEHPNLRIEGPDLAHSLREERVEVVLAIPVLPPRTVVVRAVDSSGAPAAGVKLDMWSSNLLGPESVITDADGRAELFLLVDPAEHPGDSSGLLAQAPYTGGLSLTLEEFAKDEVHTFRAARLVSQRVHVVDEEGEPVAGVELDDGQRGATTDASGEANLVLPPSGRKVRAAGYADVLLAPSADGSTVRVQMKPLVAYAVRLVIPPGAPAGHYLVEVKSGTTVVVNQPYSPGGGRSATLELWLAPGAYTVDAVSRDRLWAARVELPRGTTSADAVVERRPLRDVVVRFVDAAGAPVARTGVRIGLADAPFFEERGETTDSAGEVRLELPDGRYGLVYARGDGGKLGPQYFDVPSEAPVLVRL
jgi:hypothetical protein